MPDFGLDLPLESLDVLLSRGVLLAAVGALLLVLAIGWLTYRHQSGKFGALTAVDIDEGTADVFTELADAEQIVSAAGELFHDPERWIHRRVERIEFTGEKVIRRRVSIDFHIPANAVLMPTGALAAAHASIAGTAGAASADLAQTPAELAADTEPAQTAVEVEDGGDRSAGGDAGARKYRLIPISLLRGWPPVLKFDLRDHQGAALTLFSKSTSSYLDLSLLRKLARSTFGAQVADEIDFALTNVTHAEGQRSAEGAQFVEETIDSWVQLAGWPRGGQAATEHFRDLCRTLSQSTLLWVAVDGEPLDRVLVKIAYDQSLNRRLTWWRRPLTALGWATEVTHIQVPHIGTAGSYHLEIAVPEPLQVVRARLRTVDDPVVGRREAAVRARRRLARSIAVRFADALHLQRPLPEEIDTSRLERVLTNRAYLYRGRSSRSAADAVAEVKLRVARRAQPRTNVIVATAVAVGLTGFNEISAGLVSEDPLHATFGASIGVLLVAPGLLAYVLGRSGEHPMATRMLSMSRALCTATLLLPVGAAVALIAAVETERPELAKDATDGLLIVAWALFGILLLGWLLPAFSSRHRDD